jgi:hypothetical protein
MAGREGGASGKLFRGASTSATWLQVSDSLPLFMPEKSYLLRKCCFSCVQTPISRLMVRSKLSTAPARVRHVASQVWLDMLYSVAILHFTLFLALKEKQK